jgi:hypothetical protein
MSKPEVDNALASYNGQEYILDYKPNFYDRTIAPMFKEAGIDIKDPLSVPIRNPQDLTFNIAVDLGVNYAKQFGRENVSAAAVGAQKTILGINQMIENLLPGKNTKWYFHEMFMRGAEDYVNMREKELSQTPERFGKDFSGALGGLGASLIVDTLTGGYAKEKMLMDATFDKVAPYLARIPGWALGSGLRTFAEQASTGDVVGGMLSGVEATALNTLYGSAGTGLRSIAAMASIGYMESYYNAFKEGRMPTLDETNKSVTHGVALGTIFTTLHMIERAAKPDQKAIIEQYNKDLAKAIDTRDMDVITRVYQDLLNDKRVSKEIKDAVANTYNTAQEEYINTQTTDNVALSRSLALSKVLEFSGYSHDMRRHSLGELTKIVEDNIRVNCPIAADTVVKNAAADFVCNRADELANTVFTAHTDMKTTLMEVGMSEHQAEHNARLYTAMIRQIAKREGRTVQEVHEEKMPEIFKAQGKPGAEVLAQDKIPTLEEYVKSAKRGRVILAKDGMKEEIDALKKGKSAIAEFTVPEELSFQYETGQLNKKLEKLGFYIHDEYGNFVMGKDKKTVDKFIENRKKVKTAYDLGKLYEYSEDDIAAFYLARRGGLEKHAYEEYIEDRKSSQITTKYEQKSKITTQYLEKTFGNDYIPDHTDMMLDDKAWIFPDGRAVRVGDHEDAANALGIAHYDSAQTDFGWVRKNSNGLEYSLWANSRSFKILQDNARALSQLAFGESTRQEYPLIVDIGYRDGKGDTKVKNITLTLDEAEKIDFDLTRLKEVRDMIKHADIYEQRDFANVKRTISGLSDKIPQSEGAGKIPDKVKNSDTDVELAAEEFLSMVFSNPDRFPVEGGSPIRPNADYGINFVPDSVCAKGKALKIQLVTMRQVLDDYLPEPKGPNKKSIQASNAAIKTAVSRKLFEAGIKQGLETPCLQCYEFEKQLTGYQAKPLSVGVRIYRTGQLENYKDFLKTTGILRGYGVGDVQASDIPSLIRLGYDLQKMKAGYGQYTKNLNAVEIFGDTGFKFLISTGKTLDIGLPVKLATKYAERYPNVGVIYVAINEADLLSALTDPRIHKIIPAHLGGGTPKEWLRMATNLDFDNFQNRQSEKVMFKGKKRNLASITNPKYVEAMEIIKKGASKGDTKSYLNAVEKASKLIGKKIEPKFKDYVDKPGYEKLIGVYGAEYGKTADIPKIDMSRMNIEKARAYMETENRDISTGSNIYASMARSLIKTALSQGVEGVEAVDAMILKQKASGVGKPRPRGWIEISKDPVVRDKIFLAANSNASTFQHELAHWYLNDLFKASKKGLVDADYRVLADWLKIKDNQTELTAQQHEMFARGWERYLREGRAPSSELSETFARFKQWLTKIYESVKQLRVPLSDDVRKVMDRMLADENESVNRIVGDKELTQDFVESVSGEFKETTVSEAIRESAMSGASTKPSKKEAAKPAQAAPATPAAPVEQAPAGEVKTEGVAPQPITNISGEIKESKAYSRVLERHEELFYQGPVTYTKMNLAEDVARGWKFADEQPDAARRVALGIDAPPPGVSDTAVSLAYAEKMKAAGNIKEWYEAERALSLRRTRSGQEIVALRGRIDENSPEHFVNMVVDARFKIAGKKIFGKDKPGFNKKVITDFIDAEKILLKEKVDAQELDIKEADEILRLFQQDLDPISIAGLRKAIKDGNITVKDLINAKSSAERRAMLGKYVSEDIATKVNTGFEKAMATKRKGALKDWAEKTFKGRPEDKASILDKIDDLKDLGVLSSDQMQTVYEDLIADKLGIRLKPAEIQEIIKRATELQQVYDTVSQNIMTSDKYWAKRKEVEDYLRSLTPSSALKVTTSVSGRGAMLLSLKSPLTNIISNTVMGGIQAFERRMASNTYTGLNNDFAMEYVKAVNKIYQASGYDISRMDGSWRSEMRLGEEITHSQGPGIARKIGRVYEDIVFKQLMGAPDVAASSIAFADSANLASSKIARAEGLAGEAAQKRALEIFQDAIKLRPATPEGEFVRSQAIADARYSTYTNEGGYSKLAMAIRNGLNDFTGDVRIGDQIMPFVKTPANVVQAGVDFSGIPAVIELFKLPYAMRELANGNKKPIQQAIDAGVKGGIGLVMSAALVSMINPDDFTGEYDSSTDSEKNVARVKNAAPNSIKVGGKWISLDYLGPLGAPFVGMMYAKKYGTDLPTMAYQYVKGAGKQVLKVPGLKEMGDLYESLKKSLSEQDIKKTIEGLSNEMVAYIRARTIPGIVNDIAKATDTNVRRTDTSAISKAQASIPGLRQKLPVAVSQVTGEPIRTEGAVSELLFGSRVKTAIDSDVVKEISRLADVNMAPSVSDIDRTSPRVKELRKQIGEEEFQAALESFADNYSSKLSKLISSSTYNRKNDEERKREINKLRGEQIDAMLKRFHYRKEKK